MMIFLPLWMLLAWMVFPILALAAESASVSGVEGIVRLHPWPAAGAKSAVGCQGENCSLLERFVPLAVFEESTRTLLIPRWSIYDSSYECVMEVLNYFQRHPSIYRCYNHLFRSPSSRYSPCTMHYIETIYSTRGLVLVVFLVHTVGLSGV